MAKLVCQGWRSVIWVIRTIVERPWPQPTALICAREANGRAAFLDESLLTLLSKHN